MKEGRTACDQRCCGAQKDRCSGLEGVPQIIYGTNKTYRNIQHQQGNTGAGSRLIGLFSHLCLLLPVLNMKGSENRAITYIKPYRTQAWRDQAHFWVLFPNTNAR